MKVKIDSVTNSNSTSFTFIFKGDHIQLYEALLKRPKLFKLSHVSGWGRNTHLLTCDTRDVIDAIDRNLNDSLIWNKQKTNNIDEKIAELKLVVDDSDGMDRELNHWEVHYIKEKSEQLKKLEKAKRLGLTGVLKIGFGDNHGEVCGGNVGTTMDYEGREIEVNDKDLIIFTEQNR